MTAGNRHCHAGKVLEVTIDLGQKENVLEETASAQTEALCGEFQCVTLSRTAHAAVTASFRALLRDTDSHSTGGSGEVVHTGPVVLGLFPEPAVPLQGEHPSSHTSALCRSS